MRSFIHLLLGFGLALWISSSVVYAQGSLLLPDGWQWVHPGQAPAPGSDGDPSEADAFREELRKIRQQNGLEPPEGDSTGLQSDKAVSKRWKEHAKKAQAPLQDLPLTDLKRDCRYGHSIAACDEAIKLDSKDAAIYIHRGLAYFGVGEYERAVSDYSLAISLAPKDAVAYKNRGEAYRAMGKYDHAIADLHKAISVDSKYASAYSNRGLLYRDKGEFARAIEDFDEAISLSPKDNFAYIDRGLTYSKMGEADRAIADYSMAISLDPKDAIAYNNRGDEYRAKGNFDQAIVDLDQAVYLNPNYTSAYYNRGLSYRDKGEYGRAIEDFDKTVSIDPNDILTYWNRGLSYERIGDRTKAIEDYTKVLELTAKDQQERGKQAEARNRLDMLKAAPPPPITVTPPPPSRRVALVIGNTAYKAAAELLNPRKDARDVAAALRGAGFAEVVERYDMGLAGLRSMFSAFEDLAKTADWAVVYYAGHGIEVDGRNYLVPVDAQLRRDSDVEDEALPLERVLTRVSVAKKLQLVILDACRDNPFARKMATSGSMKRSISTRGLARFENLPTNLMIAYSAGKGEAALDGAAGENSPYAKALVKYLAEPQLELGIFFRKVRADVLAATQSKQRPFEDSSLTDVNLFFRQAGK